MANLLRQRTVKEQEKNRKRIAEKYDSPVAMPTVVVVKPEPKKVLK